MFWKNRNSGFIQIPILIGIIIAITIIGGGVFVSVKKYTEKRGNSVNDVKSTTTDESEVERLKKEIEGLKKQPPKVVVKEVPAPTPKPTKQPTETPKDHGDNDNDGLENWIEDEIGTDKNKSDTDGDGVPDGLDEHPLSNSSIINKIYQVKDDGTGLTFPIRINVPLDLYIMYKDKLRHDFESGAKNIANYAIYQDKYVQDIITQVIIIAHDYNTNQYQIFRNLVGQIVYNEDKFSGYDEYPKYPTETIVDGSGDCEDSAILLAALLRGFQYRWQTVFKDDPLGHQLDGENIGFIVMTGHIAVGYWVPNFEKMFDPSWEYYNVLNIAYYIKDAKKYCYVEATSNDFAPCEVPQQVNEISKNAQVYPLN